MVLKRKIKGSVEMRTLQTEIAGTIMEELRYLGYMVDLLSFDSERKSIILIVKLPDEPKTFFKIKIWEVKKDLVEREQNDIIIA